MKPEEVVVRVLLGAMHFFAIFVIASTLHDANVAGYLIVIWCISALLIGLAMGSFFHFFKREWTWYFFIGALVAAMLAVVLHNHLIPVCGDAICSPGECKFCTKDCGVRDCENGVCENTETCATSKDCACFPGTACATRKNATQDDRGCVPIICGDRFCDSPESSSSCCIDCGCGEGFNCANNVCLFEQPRISFIPYLAAPALSATTLAGNPSLTNESGSPRPLYGMEFKSTKNIYDVTVNFTLASVQRQAFVGTMPAGQAKTVFFYLTPDPTLLSIINDKNTNISIAISYFDVQREHHVFKRPIPFTILGRSASDKYSNILLYTTNQIIPAARTPEGIWDEIRFNMSVVQHAGTQFPNETLRMRTANRNDMTVLLYSAYLGAGLRPAIMENDDGYFVRIRTNDAYVTIDPIKIDSTFQNAIITSPGFNLFDEKTREKRNFTMLNVE